jgi:hypothetical protein
MSADDNQTKYDDIKSKVKGCAKYLMNLEIADS